MKKELTQEIVDKVFEEIKSEWDKAVAESGKTQAVFIATNRKYAAHFMHNYKLAQDATKAHGLSAPDLFPGVEIKINYVNQ